VPDNTQGLALERQKIVNRRSALGSDLKASVLQGSLSFAFRIVTLYVQVMMVDPYFIIIDILE
jgi:hypothetical protein